MLKNKLILMLCAIGITLSMATKVMAANNIERIWGNDRYDTAIQVSKSGWSDGAEYAVLANGENFPDALSATPLAKKYNAPILLNPSSTLDSRVEGELKRLCVKQVFIIGGSAVVPDSVKNKLEQLNIKTTRLWGQNRYETSIKIAEQLDFNGQVAVANGEGFADALSISPIAAQKSMPVILTPSNTLPDATAKYIKNSNITKTYIVGENDVVSDKIANSFPNSERIWGSSKYDTNIAVLNKFKNDLDLSNIYLANGENFPDALAGSALAAKNSSAITLVNNDAGQTTKDFISSSITSKSKTNILGGSGVIPTELINDVLSLVGNTSGNISFGGTVAKQGEWIYYLGENERLYKSKEDGSSVTKLFDIGDSESSINGVSNINVVGDWVYYSTGDGIYKIKTDGTSKTKIFDHSAGNITVIGDIIYFNATYMDELPKPCFFKMNTDGTGTTLLGGEDIMQSLNIVGDWAYYINWSDNHRIYKMKLDGSSKTKVTDEYVQQMIVDSGYMYYSRSYGIYKTKLDGSETNTIISNPNIWFTAFNIANGWIYYPSNDGQLYKVKTDGSDNIKIIDPSTLKLDPYNGLHIISSPSIVGNWIYYTCKAYGSSDDERYFKCKAKIDGSENTTIDFSK